jgi:L-alanine-DL-glutamate epimerase-like enolase superfamily enzyme
MKITRVTAAPVRLPLARAPYTMEGAGTKFHWGGKRSRKTPKRPGPVMEYVLVCLETDAGLTGIGEAAVDIGFFGYTLEQVRYAIEDYLGPQWLGKDPFDREYLLGLIDFRENNSAVCGLDLALHDLIGKALKTPVCVLLGGRQKTAVPVSIEIAGGPPEGMAKECVAYMAKGVRAFKAKIGGDPDADAQRLRAIREAVGLDVSLRADANQGYSPKEAIRLCRLAEKQDLCLELLEQPVVRGDLQGMAFVRRSVDTLIEADESCFTPSDAMQIIRHEAADVLNIKLNKAGGLYQAKKIAALAEAAGLKCVMGTSWGLGVEIAAKLHMASSTMLVTDAVEFTEIGLHGNLLVPPHDTQLALPVKDGCLPVPDGPGLGVVIGDLAIE